MENNTNSYTYGMNYVSGVENKKKGSALAVVGVAAVIIAAGSALAYNFVPVVKNTARMTFMTPDSYFATVQKENISKLSSGIAQNYDKSRDFYTSRSIGAEINMKAELDEPYEIDDGMEINNAEMNLSIATNKEVMSEELSLMLNDTEITTASMVMDIANMGMYMKIPGLSDKYINFSPDTVNDYYRYGRFSDVLSKGDDIYDIFTADVIEEKINTYGYILTDDLKECSVNIEKNCWVKAADVECKYTRLEIELTVGDARNICVDLLEEMKNDSEIEKAFSDYIDKLNRYDDDAKTYKDYVQEAIDELNDTTANADDVYFLDVYVDAVGTVRGYEFRNEEADDSVKFAMAKDGDIYGLELTLVSDNEEDYSVKIKAAEKGGCFDGVCDINVDDENFSVGFENLKLNTGEYTTIDGTLSMEFDKEYLDISDITIELEGSENSQKISFDLPKYGDFSMTYKLVEKPDVARIPTGTLKLEDIDESRAEEWLREMFEKLGWDYDAYYNDDYYDYDDYGWDNDWYDDYDDEYDDDWYDDFDWDYDDINA